MRMHASFMVQKIKPVVDEIVVVARCFAVRGRLHPHSALDKLVALQRVEHRAQLLAVELEQLQHVLLPHTGVADQDVQGECMIHPVETPHHLLGQALQSRGDFGQ